MNTAIIQGVRVIKLHGEFIPNSRETIPIALGLAFLRPSSPTSNPISRIMQVKNCIIRVAHRYLYKCKTKDGLCILVQSLYRYSRANFILLKTNQILPLRTLGKTNEGFLSIKRSLSSRLQLQYGVYIHLDILGMFSVLRHEIF